MRLEMGTWTYADHLLYWHRREKEFLKYRGLILEPTLLRNEKTGLS